MPTLLVLRHGKSDWKAEFGTDEHRPLARRGRRAARTMGRHLAAVGPAPNLALSSPALRAHDTVLRVLEAAGVDCPVRVVPSFYDGGAPEVLDELRSLEDASESVLVVGHEPAWSELIGTLTGARVRFPTAALARLDIDVAWGEIGPECATLEWLVRPRELQAAEEED